MKKLEFRRPLTITVANSKGGVGKTTIIRYLSYALAQNGYKVLVADADPQANLTKTMIVTKELYSSPDEVFVLDKTMMAGIVENNVKDLIVPIMANLDCIPSHIDFKQFPSVLSRKYGAAVEGIDSDWHEIESNKVRVLKDFLEPVKNNYDFILIDTPPTVSDYTRNATFASDYVIVAFQTQSDSLDGAISYINEEMAQLVNEFGAESDVVGILPNQMTYQGSIDTTVVADATRIFGEENLFENIIPYSKRVQSAPRIGLRHDSYWDKKLYEEIIQPLTSDFISRVAIMEGVVN